MMREIKFRAWDKKDKRMIVDKQGFIPLIVTNKSVFKLDPTSEKDRWIEIDKNRFELMQYTGLKDKNGKEIYEGDIIKSNSHKPTTFKIEFIEGGFCATQNDKDYPLDINHFYPSVGCMIEVIGNIYENPELLESK
jgi:uncharacterized phage protein (TIGR01671 family)